MIEELIDELHAAEREYDGANREVDRLLDALALIPVSDPRYAVMLADAEEVAGRRTAAGDRMSRLMETIGSGMGDNI